MSTVFRNARVYGHPAATGLAVEDGRILWIGDTADAAAGTDLGGALVTPAFVDAHVHATSTGLALTGLDLRGCRSLAGALDAVARVARANGGRPILGGGWNETDWPEGRPPTAGELDRASFGGVVYLARVDIHSAVVSSALIAAVPGVQGLAGFRPDGWLGEPDAHDAVREAAHQALTAGQRRDAQRAALRAAAGLGIACVHEMAGPVISSPDDLAELLTLAGEEPLPEVIGYWGELGGVEQARALGAIGAAGDLFCDGSLGSNTAALHAPYTDRPDTTGWLRYEVDELVEHIRACDAAGLQAGFHAIGDAAVDRVLEAFEQALGPGGARGHRIEHLELVRSPERFAATGLWASMQPVFDALWGGDAGMYAQRLGVERALNTNRFAELAAAGVRMAFGSDSPVTELGPWAAVHAAAGHHDHSASISRTDAFAAHTRGGWEIAGRTGEGVLEPGAPATFAVWDAAELGPDGLPEDDPACLGTYLRGVELDATR